MNALSGSNALQTDTLNPYPSSNESAVVILFDSLLATPGFSDPQFSITFWHYYNTDTLTDLCKLQWTMDSGKTWIVDPWGMSSFPFTSYYGSLSSTSGPFYPDSICWSGNSGGWRKESLCIVYPGVKGIELPLSYGIRFLFTSDSVQTNKPGWMIDNIQMRTPMHWYGLSKVQGEHDLIIYPNPSSSGTFKIDYPSSYVSGSIELYNTYGQK